MQSGYQITQQRLPIAVNGQITFTLFDKKHKEKPTSHRIRIKQVQLEQDSGKSLHDDVNHETLVDLNRAGKFSILYLQRFLQKQNNVYNLGRIFIKHVNTRTC